MTENIIPFDGSSDQPDPPQNPKFPLIPVAQCFNAPPYSWIIKGILPQAELAVIYGPPGCGKSFLALHMAFCIATGTEFEGKKMRGGRVVIIAGEDPHGTDIRCQSYAIHHKLNLSEITNFDLIKNCPDFHVGDDAAIIASNIGAASVIFVETTAKILGAGDENKGQDMSIVIGNALLLAKKTGALVVLIHHTGKNASQGARGWSGLKAAVDTEIEVSEEETGRKCKITKQKNGPAFQEWGFKLQSVDLGRDDDGEMITSCVYQSADIPIKPKRERKAGALELIVLDVMSCYPELPEPHLIEKVVNELPKPAEGKRDRRHERVCQTIEILKSKRKIIPAI